jgi:hypothetical protein
LIMFASASFPMPKSIINTVVLYKTSNQVVVKQEMKQNGAEIIN